MKTNIVALYFTRFSSRPSCHLLGYFNSEQHGMKWAIKQILTNGENFVQDHSEDILKLKHLNLDNSNDLSFGWGLINAYRDYEFESVHTIDVE